jgi:hypothetical protein
VTVERSEATLAGTVHSGRVASFDEHRGVGIVVDPAGGRWPFHCVSLADGTRTIAVDVPVRFVARAGVLGRWEAADITAAPH